MNYMFKSAKGIMPYLSLTIFIILTIVIVVFASFSGDVSGEQSSTLGQFIVSFLSRLNINLSATQLDSLQVFIRKAIGHFGLFFLNGIFATLSGHYWLALNSKAKTLVVFSIGVFLAGLSEFIQVFAPERGPSFGDVLIDVSGFVLGILFSLIMFNLIAKKDAYKK